MKMVINQCYGGFNVSQKVFEYLDKVRAPKHIDELYLDDNRSDPYLVEAVETLGEEANGRNSKLAIVEWPDNIPYKVTEYDGWEEVTIHITEFMRKHIKELENSETPLASDLKEYYNHIRRFWGLT